MHTTAIPIHALASRVPEADMSEKGAVSHRGRALAEFAAEFPKAAKWLEQRLAEVKPPKPDHREFLRNDWSRERGA